MPDPENDAWELVTAASCIAAGSERQACGREGCIHEITREIAALEHEWGEWVVTAATCEAAGSERRDCTRIGCIHYEVIELPALGHIMPDPENDEWELVAAATCIAAGSERQACGRAGCDHEVTRPIAALGHAWGAWAVSTAPTCEVAGSERRDCTRTGCIHYEERELPALGHMMPDPENDEWELVTASTCVAAGVERQECGRAGCDHEVTRPIAALEHAWGEWVVTREPTATMDGEERRDCTRVGCTHFETRAIIATGVTDVTVTFNLNGGVYGGNPALLVQTLASGGNAIALTAYPTREGFIFNGWSPALNLVNVTANRTFTAQWVQQQPQPQQWTVRFVLAGGVYGGNQTLLTQTVINGENATALTSNPTRDGYRFTGWSPVLNLTNVTANRTFTAQWAEDYVVTPPPQTETHTWFMMGRAGGVFVPAGNITRAEVATMLVRTMIPGYSPTLPLPTRMPFPDVSANDWFYGYVAWAYDAGFIEGRPDGTFDPRAQISRQEVAAMVVRATNTTILSAGDFSIVDADQISNWAQDYVYTVYRQGWMTGNSQNQLQPRRSITRAETAAVFSRVLERGVTNADSLVNVADDLRLFPDVASSRWYYYYVIEATHTHEFFMEDGVEIWTSVSIP